MADYRSAVELAFAEECAASLVAAVCIAESSKHELSQARPQQDEAAAQVAQRWVARIAIQKE